MTRFKTFKRFVFNLPTSPKKSEPVVKVICNIFQETVWMVSETFGKRTQKAGHKAVKRYLVRGCMVNIYI